MPGLITYNFSGRSGHLELPSSYNIDETVGSSNLEKGRTVSLCHQYNFFRTKRCRFGARCRFVHIPNCRRVINTVEQDQIFTASDNDDDDEDNDSSENDDDDDDEDDEDDDVDINFDFTGAYGSLPSSDFENTNGRTTAIQKISSGNVTYRRAICRQFVFTTCPRGRQCFFLHPRDEDLAQKVADGQTRQQVMRTRQDTTGSTTHHQRRNKSASAQSSHFSQTAYNSFTQSPAQQPSFSTNTGAASSYSTTDQNQNQQQRNNNRYRAYMNRPNPAFDSGSGSYNLRRVQTRGSRPARQAISYSERLDTYQMPTELARFLPKNKSEALDRKLLQAAEIPARNLIRNVGCQLLSPFDQNQVVERGLLHPSSRELFQCDNPQERLHCQLWAEEAKCISDLLSFSKENVEIKPVANRSNEFTVPAEGVSEKRPSVLRGDVIHVRPSSDSGNDESQWDAGYVVFVNAESVQVSFSRHSFVAQRCGYEGMRFDVTFCDEDRTQWRMQHRAIEKGVFINSQTLRQLKKPTLHTRPNYTAELQKNLAVVNLNEEQNGFVAKVCDFEGAKSTSAQMLFGPPGSGKTTTVCASIAALASVYCDAKILVCCPSNAAADVVVERLSDYPIISNYGVNMIRVHALSRSDKEVSDRVISFSRRDGAGGFLFPKKEEFSQYSIIVATLATTGKLFGCGLPSNFFTHIFVDEAGQATEAQLLLATTFMRNMRTSLIMAGDPLQLGPVLHSGSCKESGMHVSPLERFINSLPQEFTTLLIKNYRSHPDILRIVNVPYKDKLVAARQIPNTVHSFQKPSYGVLSMGPPAVFVDRDWKSPLVFCHVEGKEEREKDSPSWKNEDEVNCIVGLVKQLINEHNEDPKNIAVLTPYILQRTRIHNKLYGMIHKERSIRLPHQSMGIRENRTVNPIDVATIEAFQGKERKIVIVSCVRSREENVGKDIKHHLGFMAQPQRSNVALSRARDFLIVVGNAKLFLTDGMRKLHEAPKEQKRGESDEIHFGGSGNWNTVIERFHAMNAIVNVSQPATPVAELFKKAYQMAHDQLGKHSAGTSHADPNENVVIDDDDDDDVQQAPLVQME